MINPRCHLTPSDSPSLTTQRGVQKRRAFSIINVQQQWSTAKVGNLNYSDGVDHHRWWRRRNCGIGGGGGCSGSAIQGNSFVLKLPWSGDEDDDQHQLAIPPRDINWKEHCGVIRYTIHQPASQQQHRCWWKGFRCIVRPFGWLGLCSPVPSRRRLLFVPAIQLLLIRI